MRKEVRNLVKGIAFFLLYSVLCFTAAGFYLEGRYTTTGSQTSASISPSDYQFIRDYYFGEMKEKGLCFRMNGTRISDFREAVTLASEKDHGRFSCKEGEQTIHNHPSGLGYCIFSPTDYYTSGYMKDRMFCIYCGRIVCKQNREGFVRDVELMVE